MEKEEEENEIGVTEVVNKIEQKQEDMFDPHQLQKNILQDNLEKQQRFNFLELEEQIVEDNSPTKLLKSQQPQIIPEQSNKRATRKQTRRKKKMYDSDEDIQEQNEPKQYKRQEQQFKVQQKLADIQLQSKPQRPRKKSSSQQEIEEKEMQALQQMVAKKEQSKKSSENYVQMHLLMQKAGNNKEQRRFAIYQPLKPNQHSFVYFKRYQSGFSEYFQAIGEDQRPVLFCENQRGCIGCNYYISLTKEMDKSNPAYLGKLRGNATGSIYQLYDNGQQPSKDYDRSKFRTNMAYIEYESNFLGMNGPRKLKVVLPNAKSLQDFDMYRFAEGEELSSLTQPTVINCKNKQPRWNDRLQSFALNFGGRVKQASIKNFILVQDREDENEGDLPNLITFGKVDDSTFSLQFKHPLSLFQAFGIAMSEFDFKLACE